VLVDGVAYKDRGGDGRVLGEEELKGCFKLTNHRVSRLGRKARPAAARRGTPRHAPAGADCHPSELPCGGGSRASCPAAAAALQEEALLQHKAGSSNASRRVVLKLEVRSRLMPC
jgi:hypothetical protein